MSSEDIPEAPKGTNGATIKREPKEESPEDEEVGTSMQKPVKAPSPKDIIDIQPLVYSFRVPQNPSPGSIMTAMLPPYWLYHDHAFGVIWMLFHKDKKYIGISQLHWCLRFLLDLKNSEGEYTGDVSICIQAVQDDLIEQYAKLGTALDHRGRQEPSKQVKQEKSQSVVVKEEPINEESFIRQNENEENVNVNFEDTEMKSPVKQEDDGRDWKRGIVKKEAHSSKKIEEFLCGANCAMDRTTDSEAHAIPLSITYNEMVSRGPAPYTEQIPIRQIFKAQTGFGSSAPEVADDLIRDVDPPKIPLSEMDTDELVNFLNNSRQQHVERIKQEIERLYGLEKFMENIDRSAFSAYITNDLAERLDRLDGQGVVKGVQDMIQ